MRIKRPLNTALVRETLIDIWRTLSLQETSIKQESTASFVDNGMFRADHLDPVPRFHQCIIIYWFCAVRCGVVLTILPWCFLTKNGLARLGPADNFNGNPSEYCKDISAVKWTPRLGMFFAHSKSIFYADYQRESRCLDGIFVSLMVNIRWSITPSFDRPINWLIGWLCRKSWTKGYLGWSIDWYGFSTPMRTAFHTPSGRNLRMLLVDR